MPRNIDRETRRKIRLANKPAFKKTISKRKRERKAGEVKFEVFRIVPADKVGLTGCVDD